MATTLVILCGGRGTRFRPLSFETPKPLVPIAGEPMVSHVVHAFPQETHGLAGVFLVGFYAGTTYEAQFAEYAASLSASLGVPVSYLREPVEAGTAAGLAAFAEELRAPGGETILVVNSDVTGDLNLGNVLDAHAASGAELTLLGTQVGKDESRAYGCMVVDPESGRVEHYAEKPEIFVSSTVSCGVFAFTPSGFDTLVATVDAGSSSAASSVAVPSLSGSAAALAAAQAAFARTPVSLEQDVIVPLVAQNKVHAVITTGFWAPVKTPAAALAANAYLLSSDRLASSLVDPDSVEFTVVGNVRLTGDATIHPSAKIGPNVVLGPGVTIGAGARVRDSIILDNVVVADNAFVNHSVIGWDSVIGPWARVEGDADAATGQPPITASILGKDVEIKPESVIRNCIVLPHKSLKSSFDNQVIL